MGLKTKIEWCDSTVNPAPCCTGCELYPINCYANALHRRHDGNNSGWPKSFTQPALFLDRMKVAANWPDLRGKTRPAKPWLDGMPRLIFLNDLGDTFAPFEAQEFEPETHWLHAYLRDIERSPHVWLLLTKWPERFREFAAAAGTLPHNIWGATTATSQESRNRIWQLLQIPQLAVRFLSYEPAIGPLDLDAIEAICETWGRGATLGMHLDWVIAGGESGPMARPSHPDWFRTIRDQCQAAGVPFFFKQWGEWAIGDAIPCGNLRRDMERGDVTILHAPGNQAGYFRRGDAMMRRVGKRASGRLLDGREWSEMPDVFHNEAEVAK